MSVLHLTCLNNNNNNNSVISPFTQSNKNTDLRAEALFNLMHENTSVSYRTSIHSTCLTGTV